MEWQECEAGITCGSLSRYLDGDFWSMKNELRRQIAGCSLFQQRYDLTLDETRDLAFERVKFTMGLPQVQRAFQEMVDKKKNFINRSLIIGEVLCTADMTTGVKCGVVCWLFGGAVMNLGSPEHIVQWFQPLKEQKFTGMFAMTERGHGSNVRGILTKATFDPVSQEFIINTQCENAEKMYIGNAMKGNYAAVFAQLIINGKSQGPHCFIVPIRDHDGQMYPGVTATDMLHKEGLHGVDNGILRFDNVRIPRQNLLDKFGSVSPDGKYHSSIKNKGARFNAMLAALTPTRLALTFQALGAMKLGLTISIRYSHSRRQFGPKNKEEVKIIEHQTQYLRLMPHLATALAITFTSRYAGEMLDEDVYHSRDLVNNRALQALVAGLKAYSTWENLACLQDCRECTGGMGYMMENRIPGLKCDSDVFVTFEGDNVVMLQVVVRELLAQYTRQYEESPVFGLLRNWTSSVGDSVRTSFIGFNVDKIGDLTFLLKAVNFRERVLQRGLAARLYNKAIEPVLVREEGQGFYSHFFAVQKKDGAGLILDLSQFNVCLPPESFKMVTRAHIPSALQVMSKKEEFFSAWNSCLHHVACLALAHIHRVTLEQFTLAVKNCPVPEDQALLMEFCLLYGTKLVFQERAWYLEHKYLNPASSAKIRNQLLELCRVVKDDALTVVAAFNIPNNSIQAPIAGIPNPRAMWAYYPQPPGGPDCGCPQHRLHSKL